MFSCSFGDVYFSENNDKVVIKKTSPSFSVNKMTRKMKVIPDNLFEGDRDDKNN